MNTMAYPLVKYEAARQALMEATRVDEVKPIHDVAVAMAAYARQARDVETLAKATELILRAARCAGHLLLEMSKQHGARGTGKNQFSKAAKKAVDAPAVSPPPTLRDLGISYRESRLWQKLAQIPEAEFEEQLSVTTEALAELSIQKILTAPKAKVYGPKEWSCRSGILGLEQALRIQLRTWPERYRPLFAELLTQFTRKVLKVFPRDSSGNPCQPPEFSKVKAIETLHKVMAEQLCKWPGPRWNEFIDQLDHFMKQIQECLGPPRTADTGATTTTPTANQDNASMCCAFCGKVVRHTEMTAHQQEETVEHLDWWEHIAQQNLETIQRIRAEKFPSHQAASK